MRPGTTFQEMDDDYVDKCDIPLILSHMDRADELAQNGVYRFNIHIGEVATDSPYAFAAFKAGNGWLITMRDRLIYHVAGNQFDNDDATEFYAGEYKLRVTRGLFLSLAQAKTCIDFFCNFGGRSPEVEWRRCSDLGYELYA
jgi:hypothetical protein